MTKEEIIKSYLDTCTKEEYYKKESDKYIFPEIFPRGRHPGR